MHDRLHPRLPVALLATALLTACGGGSDAPGQADAARIAACDLVTQADIEAVTGAPVNEPDDYSSGSYSGGSSLQSSCIYDIGVIVRAWHPYRAEESTAAAWTARMQAERDESISSESDAQLRAAMQAIRLEPIEDLGVPAALEDTRQGLGTLALHVYASGDGGVYLSVYAADLDTARAITEKALAKLQ
jgi:hypothetical protein